MIKSGLAIREDIIRPQIYNTTMDAVLLVWFTITERLCCLHLLHHTFLSSLADEVSCLSIDLHLHAFVVFTSLFLSSFHPTLRFFFLFMFFSRGLSE